MNLLEHLSLTRDPRIDRNKKHDLSEMLFVAGYAAISGAEGWLRRFVRLDNGIRVDDTSAWVLSRIAPSVRATALEWLQWQ